jgi:hypothetical protein
MKFVLSRKGFDSESGGHPSPILPDGRLISFPIPSNDNIFYDDLALDNGQYHTYCDLLKELTPSIKFNNENVAVDANTKCHLDPDIYKDVLKRPAGWRPLFGQIDAAETHLENKGIKENDVFIFFGSFRQTREIKGKIIFDKIEKEKHIIFGYLQIGKIIRCDMTAAIENWITYHPHFSTGRRKKGNNTIYTARERLSWNAKMPGAGPFHFHEDLVLTKRGCSKSIWQLDPSIFKGLNISFHSQQSWKKDCFYSAGRGQEFVIEDNSAVEKYFQRLIENNYQVQHIIV